MPLSMTATTIAVEPVDIRHGPTAPIVDSPHWLGKRGSLGELFCAEDGRAAMTSKSKIPPNFPHELLKGSP